MSSPAEPPAAPVTRWLRFVQSPWAAALLGLICSLNTLANEFVYDDIHIIRDNPRVHTLDNWGDILLGDWWHPLSEQVLPEFHRRDRLYRPLTLASFAIEYQLFGIAAGAYHALNVAWHTIACGLMWLFAWRLLGDRLVATIAALWFAVHPIHCEAVANVVGRAEVMAGVFMLGGLVLLLPAQARPGWGRVFAAAGVFLLALLSKESAICYAPVALLAIWLLRRRVASERAGWRWWVARTAVLLLPAAIYLPLRYHALDGHMVRDSAPSPVMNPLVNSDYPARLVDAATVVGHYARLFTVPRVLSCNYGVAVIDPGRRPEALTWLGLATTAALVVAACGLGRASGAWQSAAVLSAMFIASYLLVSNAVLIIGVAMAERLMYWPSVPVLLLLSVLLVAAWRRLCVAGRPLARVAPLVRIGGLALLAALGLRTYVRNGDWSTNLALFAVDVQTFPQSVHLNNSVARENLVLAETLPRRADRIPYQESALYYIEQALRILPNHVDSMYVKGRALHALGRRDEAIAVIESALLLSPLDKGAQATLAELRDPTIADRIHEIETALATQPSDLAATMEVIRLCLVSARSRDALRYLEVLARTRPNDPEVLELFVEALAVTEQYDRAIEVGRRALAVQPDNWRIHVNLTSLLAERDPAQALIHAERAYALRPQELHSIVNLAGALAANGRAAQAIKMYELALAGLPAGSDLRNAIQMRLEELRRSTP